MSYQYGQNGQQYIQYDTYNRKNVVLQPSVPLDPSMVMPVVAAGAVAGFIAFVINPVMGIIAFFFGVFATSKMMNGELDDAAYAGKAALWMAFISVFAAICAYVVIVVLQVERWDLFKDNRSFSHYLPRVFLPVFTWNDVWDPSS